MSAWSRLAGHRTDTLVIFAVQNFDAEAAAAARACARGAGRVRILLDPYGRTARRFNALWLPRAYALDTRGRVTYVQPPFTMDSQSPSAVWVSWRRGRLPS